LSPFPLQIVLAIAIAGGASGNALPASESLFTNQRPNSLVSQCVSSPAIDEVIPEGQLHRAIDRLSSGAVVVRGQGALSVPVPARNPLPLGEWQFHVRDRKVPSPYSELAYRTDQWYGSTFWSGPDWTRVGKDWHHPGENTPSVRRFTVPEDGSLKITGRVFKLHRDGDGVRLAVLHGERTIWSAEIDGADGEGVEPQLAVEVRKGDALRFVVHKRGNIYCDTTHWDPVITCENGRTYQASHSFQDLQGQDGWYYEQLQDAEPAVPPVQIVAWTKDLAQRLYSATEEAVEFSGSEFLPLVVIADPATASGALFLFDSADGWKCRTEVTADGVLKLTPHGVPVPSSSSLPTTLVAPFEGPWTGSLAPLATLLLSHDSEIKLPIARAAMESAHQRLTADLVPRPALDLLLMLQAEWQLDDRMEDLVASYVSGARDHLARAETILNNLPPQSPGQSSLRQLLRQLIDETAAAHTDLPTCRRLYLRSRLVKRSIMLSNPLLDFRELLVCKRVPPSYSHLVGQYYGWRQRPGGGLFVLAEPGTSLRCRNVVAGQLPAGNFLEPRLSYDARRILFSYVPCSLPGPDPEQLVPNEEGPDEGYFHIFEVHVSGDGLRQLTQGTYDDLMPVYLPDGDIVFTSTRRRGYSRCFGPQFSRRWDSYTLHRMSADGTNVRKISANDVNEWFPSISHQGQILFARWDYIDRDAVTHQNLWSAHPDGTNPVAVWGNATPKPHCTFQAKPIPNSNKIAFIASAHHALTAGPVCILDPAVDANSETALVRVTPGPFPEAESALVPEYHESPWPLSEDLFLVAYSRSRLRFEGEHLNDPNPDNALGVYVIDRAGNRELIYRDPLISTTTPIPLRPQPAPPVVHRATIAATADMGEMMVGDVYQGLGDVPRGTIKALRVVQIFPKTTPLANIPRIGIAGEENARAILGTVPVEVDGSARFLVPANKPLLFQALDWDGLAYQTMRSTTYVQAGERIGCVGCHEHRHSAAVTFPAMPLAFRRDPSAIDPGEIGGRPFSFADIVQPVLDRHCVRCHGVEKSEGGVDLTGTPHEGFSRSYWALCRNEPNDASSSPSVPPKPLLVPRFEQRNQIQTTVPGGNIGARGSRLVQLLRDGHEQVQLPDNDLRRVAAWVDLNAVFLGAYLPEELAQLQQGEQLTMPRIQ
jgi:hypothetical protein